MTVVYELSKWHQIAGRETLLVVSKNTRHDYDVGVCIEVMDRPEPVRRQRIVDALMGRAGLPRVFSRAAYAPSVAAIPSEFTGTVMLHNAAGCAPSARKAAPLANLCLYCHNNLFSTYSNFEVRRTLNAVDKIVCVSNFIADLIKKRLGSDDPRVFVALNGVDTERFKPPVSHQNMLPPLILFVGRVQPQKGPDLLIKAGCILAERGVDFRIRIVGSSNFSADDPLTEYESQLRQIARPIADKVEFVPFVDRTGIVSHYLDADVFCAPSNWDEPVSLTVPEAMASGIATVASRRGGIPEVGADALLYFEPPDVNELAHQIETLIVSRGLRDQMGQRARQRSEEISWRRRYDALWKGVLNPSPQDAHTS